MTNNLIAVTPGTLPKVRLYIQFIADITGQRPLPYIAADGSQENFGGGNTFYQMIRSELVQYSHCLGFNIQINLAPTTTGTGDFWPNSMKFRDPQVRNPFQPPDPNRPPEPLWHERDSQNNPVPLEPDLPLIRFYIGDGESLNTDIIGGSFNNNDTVFDEQGARIRRRNNFANNFNMVIPNYVKEYATRTSFFSRPARAGYLFTDGRDQIHKVFMHELGHVLGLQDRYIEGIDERTPADNFLSFIGRPTRATAPLSAQHVNSILGGLPVAAVDIDYDPQNNLMSSRSYSLSTYQKSLILARQLETPPYVKDDFILLLSLNSEAERPTIPADVALPCRKTETHYFPSAVSALPATALDHATFEKQDGTIGDHNAFFRSTTGALLSARYDGRQEVLMTLMKGLAPVNGAETLRMIYRYLGL